MKWLPFRTGFALGKCLWCPTILAAC